MGVALSLLIGALGVLQNTFNKQFASTLGMAWAVLVNGLVLCSCSVVFFFVVRAIPAESLPPLYRTVANGRAFGVADALPGVLGFLIIASCPWVIERHGATKVFIAIIAAQLVVSMLWDLQVESIPVSGWRVAGGALALVGAVLASL